MQNILNEEKEFFSRVSEYITQVEKNDKVILTKFLTLREQQIIQDLVKKSSISYSFFGGYLSAERKRCLLFPKSFTTSDKNFSISCFKITYNKRYLKLTHQNVLGTLMSMKIDRSLFGDIVFTNDECLIITSSEIENILLYELKTINKVPISLERYNEAISVTENFITKEIIISSMRIDNLISHVYNLSRENAKELVLNNSVYRNWQLIINNSIKCEVNDVISVRKYGRFIVSNILRNTKTNKIVLEIKLPAT